MTFRTSNVTKQLKTNLVMKIEYDLLNKGYYNNIDVNETNFLNNDFSSLSAITNDSTWADRQSWQAPKKNWVYEEDVTVPNGATAPILPSGIYINNNFYPKDHSSYGHVYNYIDGVVIFTSGSYPAATANVNAEYSYKNIKVGLANNDIVHALHNDYFENDGIPDDVTIDTQGGPSVWIESSGGEVLPKALGGSITVRKNIHIHCVSNDDYEYIMDDIADRIMYMHNTRIDLIDVDQMPETLDWRGSKTTTYRSYSDMESDDSIKYMGAFCVSAERVDLFSQRKDWNRIRIDMVWEMIGVPR